MIIPLTSLGGAKGWIMRKHMNWAGVGVLLIGMGSVPARAADPAPAEANQAQWLGFNGEYDATRYSPLKQIRASSSHW